jgi:hypothetical protein
MGVPVSVLEQLRAHLVTNALVRLPGTVGAAPVCRLPGDPSYGTPEPDAGQDVVVDLDAGARVPWRQPFGDRYIEQRIVDVTVRSTFPWPGELLQRQIANLVIEQRGVFFGDLRVEWCRLFRGDQLTGSDSRLFERMQSFTIAARVKSLAGDPYVP